jgi:hypothetical protein
VAYRIRFSDAAGEHLASLTARDRATLLDRIGPTSEAGQSFSELPGDRHGVSANASETKPAKLLAVFVVDTNETELTIPFGN